MSLGLWSLLALFLLLGTVPAIVGEGRETLWIWGLAVFGIVVFPIAQFADAVKVKLGNMTTIHILMFIALLFVLSFGCDVLYIALTRRMLRNASHVTSLPKIIGIIALNVLLGTVLALGPFIIGLVGVISIAKLNGPQSLGTLSIGLMLGSSLNSIDILACSVFLVLMLFMLAHRLIWPVIERPLHAGARFGIIEKKKLLWAVGTAFIFVPSHGVSLWNWLLHKVLVGG